MTRKLEPGAYRTEEFEPAFSFRVGGGWTYLPLGSKPDDLALARGRTGLRFFRVGEVFEPDERYDVVGAPDGLVGWLRRHPYLRTSAPEPVKVGGVEGKRFDVAVGELPRGYSGGCGPDCVPLFRLSDATVLVAPKGEKAREILREDVGGRYGDHRLRRPGRRGRRARARGAGGDRHRAVEETVEASKVYSPERGEGSFLEVCIHAAE